MNQISSNPATLRLPFKEKFAYGMGDLGSNIPLDIGILYLPKLYIDVLGLPGTYGGIVSLIAKFLTAFTNMGTGTMLDPCRRVGSKGKFRPSALYTAFPVTLLMIADLVGTPFEITGKTVMVTVLLMPHELFFGMMNCSYGATVPAITKDPGERASLAAWRQGGATLGLLPCTVGFVPVMSLVEGNPQLGYILAATLFLPFGLLLMQLCYAGVKERYAEVELVDATQKPGLLQSFRAIAGNRPLFILCVTNLCILGAFSIKLAIQAYYTQYVLNDPILLSWMGFFSIGRTFTGVFLMPGMARRLGKKKAYVGGLLIWVAGGLFNYSLGGSPVNFATSPCLVFLGSAFVNSPNWALVSDMMEYGEWRTGIRSEDTVYISFIFFHKVSQALTGFSPGWMLAQIGYVPNVVQSASTVEGLRRSIFIYPCILAVITTVTMGCFYNFSKKMYVRIAEGIEACKQPVW